jgi:hypothetical protein
MDEPVDPPKERKHYRYFQSPEEKLAKHRAIKEAAEARQKAREEERRQLLVEKRKTSKALKASLAAALKAKEREPDPDDSPERQAERQAARQSGAKGQPVLPGRLRSGKLGAQDVALILALKEKEATNREIAKILNIGDDTVARAVAEFADTRPLAKAYLRKQAETIAGHAVQASQEAALKGDADPALELLDRLDVAPKRVEESDKSKVMIIVGGNSISALPQLPVLDVTSQS